MQNINEIAQIISGHYPIIQQGLLPNWIEQGTSEWAAAEEALAYVFHTVPDPGTAGLEQIIDAFAQTSIDFLRLQARFRITGEYARSSADGLVDELYGSEEEMSGHYLHGLAMTYAMWPNHARLFDFYTSVFVHELDASPRVLEIGPGHGLLGHALLSRRPEADYTAIDISAPALKFVERAFSATEVASSRVALIPGDATDATNDRIPSTVDALVYCEVLEHVDNPATLLAAIRKRLTKSGRAFLSTVANLEAVDHVYLFRNEHDIRAMLCDCGFDIVRELVLPLPGDTSQEHIPLNYACVVEPTK